VTLRQQIEALETALHTIEHFQVPPCQVQPMFEMAGSVTRLGSPLTVESNRDAEVEVIVIRQPTTKTSGYHTDAAAIRRITNAAWHSVAHVLAGVATP
jgi:hypothetical protein